MGQIRFKKVRSFVIIFTIFFSKIAMGMDQKTQAESKAVSAKQEDQKKGAALSSLQQLCLDQFVDYFEKQMNEVNVANLDQIVADVHQKFMIPQQQLLDQLGQDESGKRKIELEAGLRLVREQIQATLIQSKKYKLEDFKRVGEENVWRGLISIFALITLKKTTHVTFLEALLETQTIKNMSSNGFREEIKMKILEKKLEEARRFASSDDIGFPIFLESVRLAHDERMANMQVESEAREAALKAMQDEARNRELQREQERKAQEQAREAEKIAAERAKEEAARRAELTALQKDVALLKKDLQKNRGEHATNAAFVQSRSESEQKADAESKINGAELSASERALAQAQADLRYAEESLVASQQAIRNDEECRERERQQAAQRNLSWRRFYYKCLIGGTVLGAIGGFLWWFSKK